MCNKRIVVRSRRLKIEFDSISTEKENVDLAVGDEGLRQRCQLPPTGSV